MKVIRYRCNWIIEVVLVLTPGLPLVVLVLAPGGWMDGICDIECDLGKNVSAMKKTRGPMVL